MQSRLSSFLLLLQAFLPTRLQYAGRVLSGFDPAFFIPVIGLMGIVVGTFIGGWFSIYRIRYKLRLQERTEAKRTAQKREESEAKRLEQGIHYAQTIEDYAQAYLNALRVDPNIGHIQILDMNRPIEVTSIYVKVRLQQETRLAFELDPELIGTEDSSPNDLQQGNLKRPENRSGTTLDPVEAIRTYRRCIIVGDPGAGKTTLLKYLALQSVNGPIAGVPELPIYIGLHEFASSGHNDLLDFAATRWEERYGFPKAEARDYMQGNLARGNALLLLDALDETVIGSSVDEAEASYKRVTNAITQVATRYHQSHIVVTARKAGYQQRAPLSAFTELETSDFRSEEIKQFVNNWFSYHPNPQRQTNASELNAKLERNPRIQALAANPLLLSLIVIVYEAHLDLPDRRAELYRQCVETLLTKWDASRDIRRRREFKPEHKRLLLEEVAWHFHTQGRRYFPESELLIVIASFLPAVGLPAEQNGQVLNEIITAHGLLKEQARGWYGFLHLTLQEYFVAQQVADQKRLDTLLEHRDDPWWEEVILLYAGYTSDASPLLQRLLGRGDEVPLQDDIFHTHLILAGRCLAARPTVRQAYLRDEVRSRLFKTLTDTAYSLTRQQIAETLSEIGGPEVNSRLISLLSNPQIGREVRESIANALGKVGEGYIARDLLPLLSNPQVDRSVYRSIAQAVGTLREPSVAHDLVLLLPDPHIDQSARKSIAIALGKLEEPSIAHELVPLLSDPQLDIDLRGSIAETLGSLGERSVAHDLLRLLSDPQLDLYVRLRIADSLGKLAGPSDVPKLFLMLTNSQLDPQVRIRIAISLGTLGERSIANELLQLLFNPQLDPFIGSSIAVALSMLGEKSVVRPLFLLLRNPQLDPLIGSSIVDALGVLGEQLLSKDLLSLLSDPQLDTDLREHLADALGELGERSIAPGLLGLLSEPQIEPGVGRSIADALGKLGERSVVPGLLQLLSEPQIEATVGQCIILALGNLGERSVVTALLDLLTNSKNDPGVGLSAVSAIIKLGDNSVVPALLERLSSQELDVGARLNIIHTLRQMADDESTVRTLFTLLEASDIADEVHQALWTICRRVGIRVFPIGESNAKYIEVVHRKNEPESKDNARMK